MAGQKTFFWIGLGVGSLLGAIAYRLSQTSKAEQLKNDMYDKLCELNEQAEELLEVTKEKALQKSREFAGKVAEKTDGVIGKAEEFKGKMKNYSSNTEE